MFIKLKTYLHKTISSLTVEPLLFGYLVAWTLQNNLTTNLIYEKVCGAYNMEDVCRNQSVRIKEETRVQEISSQLVMFIRLIQNLPSILFVLFMGSWSDKNGRKLPIILPLVGSLVSSLLCLANSYFWWLSPENVLFTAVPRALTGGSISLMMASYSYISDISTNEARTTRIALVDLVYIISSPLGLYISDVLFTAIDYSGVYTVSSLIALVCIIYAVVCLKETRSPLICEVGEFKKNGDDVGKCQQLFNVFNVKETMKTCLKKRSNRASILLLMINVCIQDLIYGTSGLDYLYTKKKFLWNYSEFIDLSIAASLSQALGNSIFLPLMSKQLQADEYALAIAGCLTKVSSLIIQSFAYLTWHLYLATLISCLSGIPISIARAKLSKLVFAEELGRIFSILASWESIIPLFSTPIYTYTYNLTINDFPGAIYLSAAFVSFTSGLIFIGLFIQILMKEKSLENSNASDSDTEKLIKEKSREVSGENLM